MTPSTLRLLLVSSYLSESYLEAAIGIEPMNKGFADLCLTTWLRRPKELRRKVKGGKMKETRGRGTWRHGEN